MSNRLVYEVHIVLYNLSFMRRKRYILKYSGE